MEENNKQYMTESLTELGLEVDNKKIEVIISFYNKLREYNEHTNLTRIVDEKDFIEKHILDSVSVSEVIWDKEENLKVIDIGTGAGFPLLPLWFFFPHWKITLVDAVNKKLNFIRQFIEVLKEFGYPVQNITVLHSRAEDLAKDKKYREKYDLAIGRAVAAMPTFVELCAPFIKREGLLIAMKSAEVDEELNQARKISSMVGLDIEDVVKFELLETGLERSFVIMSKTKPTPPNFPRKAGEAKRIPIM